MVKSVKQIQTEWDGLYCHSIDCQFDEHLHAIKGFLCMHEDNLSQVRKNGAPWPHTGGKEMLLSERETQ